MREDIHPDTQALLDIIIKAAPSSRTPEALRNSMEEIATTHRSAVTVLRTAMLGGACAWIEEAKKIGCGEEEAMRIAAVTLEWSAAMLVRRMYQILGKPFDPGRFALVACDQALAAMNIPMGVVDDVIAEAATLSSAPEPIGG
mgnify:CR=1 FL=1